MSREASSGDPLRECREAARRRLRDRVAAIVRAIRAPLADVLREHALVHLPPTATARLRLVHPSWARRLSSPLFAAAHAAAPRRLSGIFVPSAGFLPFDGAVDTVPSPTLSFIPASAGLVAVLSSSHGVACCFSPADDGYFVCNPATRSWAGVPSPMCRPRPWPPRPAIVVLFDTSIYNFRGDYTLVCAFEPEPYSGTYCFQVFTSGAGTWRVADAVAPAEGLVAASGVAAGGTAWWRTSIGTAVGFNPVTGRVELALCPGDSGQWEIGAAAGKLHCAVRAGLDVVLFRRRDERGGGGWEETARVAVAAILSPSPQPFPAMPDVAETVAPQQMERAHGPEHTAAAVAVDEDSDESEDALAGAPRALFVANEALPPEDGVQLLGFQGAQLEVVVRDGGRVVAFDTVTRRRREIAVPGATEWSAGEYAVHTNTLAPVAPAVLTAEPVLTKQPEADDEENENNHVHAY